MAVTAIWYPRAFESAFEGEWDWVSDTIYVALCTSTYTPADTHQYWSDVTNEVANGNGYTTNGELLGTKTNTFVDDASVSAWAASTAYAVGDLVRPASADGHIYRCIIAGTSGAGEPTFDQTPGQDTTDSGVTWTEWGRGYVKLDGGNISWTSSTITARYAVVYDRTPVTDATRPLLGLVDFGQDESSSSGPFNIDWHTDGILQVAAGFGGT